MTTNDFTIVLLSQMTPVTVWKLGMRKRQKISPDWWVSHLVCSLWPRELEQTAMEYWLPAFSVSSNPRLQIKSGFGSPITLPRSTSISNPLEEKNLCVPLILKEQPLSEIRARWPDEKMCNEWASNLVYCHRSMLHRTQKHERHCCSRLFINYVYYQLVIIITNYLITYQLVNKNL